jgi:hypothetical protein
MDFSLIPMGSVLFDPNILLTAPGDVAALINPIGTAEGPLLCTGQDLVQNGCEPGVLQQNIGSHYLAAQNAQGGSSLVTTTSLYTLEDDIIQPELVDPTSNLPGATVIPVQREWDF